MPSYYITSDDFLLLRENDGMEHTEDTVFIDVLVIWRRVILTFTHHWRWLEERRKIINCILHLPTWHRGKLVRESRAATYDEWFNLVCLIRRNGAGMDN